MMPDVILTFANRIPAPIRAIAAKDNPAIWLQLATVYGEIGHDPRVIAAFATALRDLQANGTKAVLQTYLAG